MSQNDLNKEKALVVFSGGQDSTTCLFYAKKHFKEVELVTFNYGQRHDKEIEVFQGVIDEIMAYLANITVPVNIMYGEEDDPLYAQSAQYIYDNVNSQDKELLKFEKSGHLMTYGDHAYRVEQSIIQFFSK